MSRRVFVEVTRGMTDKTATCVFPWEVDILVLVHGSDVKEVSIDQMCSMQGVVKVEKVKLKHTDQHAPGLREQFEAMCYVDPDEDPANDPGTEYNRLAEKYGMDKEFPMPMVERIYGQFTSGAFTAKLKEHAKDRMPRPAVMDEPEEKNPADMSVAELRAELKKRGVPFKVTEGKVALQAKLEAAFQPA